MIAFQEDDADTEVTAVGGGRFRAVFDMSGQYLRTLPETGDRMRLNVRSGQE
ncbi:hypothetical protein GCM10007866_28400 [Gluconobacter albidus]|uniref:Uncharacterized protein n=1 Tax=Gluconobacter albidus TaxID=318683 RepID=A0ABQ5X656_9PROT|nr:hypothetical protein AA3250_0415 [Gluconobacter albidus NBRC 3250]GLQ70387.1 hypothetical protein GCM10007866_28400 [Gluconobacter albidus]